jgi:hypothetical protein
MNLESQTSAASMIKRRSALLQSTVTAENIANTAATPGSDNIGGEDAAEKNSKMPTDIVS